MEINDKILVTCPILTYKKFQFLYEALDSIFMQDYPNIEIIIGDDGSPEFPYEEIKNYIELKKGGNITKVIIYTNERNLGTVKNINKAYKLGQGKYIIGLPGDDIFYSKDSISKIVERFEQTSWDIMSCRRVMCDERTLSPIELIPSDNEIRKIEKLNTPFKQYISFAKCRYFRMASGSSTYHRRESLIKNNFFNEDYFLWEDGPYFIKYTRNNQLINTAYDIISIKYRDGGISSAKNAKKVSSINKIMESDIELYFKKEIEPYIKEIKKIDLREIEYAKISIFYRNNKIIGILKKLKFFDIGITRLVEKLNEKRGQNEKNKRS